MTHKPKVLAVDAGGTMCDVFLIDEQGDFVVGKAQTTPEDESKGFLKSAADGLSYWNLKPEDVFSGIVSGVYSGTAMINRLLSRKGQKVGLLVSAGQEDYLVMERGIQTYLGYSYSDRLHIQTHVHNEPLIPKDRIFGIRQRTDLFGNEVIPLYEHEVRRAVESLVEDQVDSICVCLLHSYRNPTHEFRIREIAEQVLQEKKYSCPIFLSAELYPTRGDFARLNTLIVEAYAAVPSGKQMRKIQTCCQEAEGKFDLRVMASHGGTISIQAKELARTLISGPIGGVVGARHLGKLLGIKNLVCTDIGGTSFDLSLITEGEYQITNKPEIARFVLALPQVQINSIGAGTGSFVRVNPTNNRLELGPDSGGAKVGMCWEESGLSTVTVTDCHVILGLINPDNFLGNEIQLSQEVAIKAVTEQIAEPLGLNVYDAAAGVIEVLENNLKNQVYSTIVGKGFSPATFTCISYGGGGPVHTAGYTEGMDFEDILIPSWAAGFSAYGCSCADFEYRYDHSVDLPFQLDQSPEQQAQTLGYLNQQIETLQKRVQEAFLKNEIGEELIEYETSFRILYAGQLNELEVKARKAKLESFQDLKDLIEDFEELYGRIYSLSARSPELGYLIATCVVTGKTEVEKPNLPNVELSGSEPPQASLKGTRKVYWKGEFLQANIWNMELLRAGNVIRGLSIIESPATTLVVPPDRLVELDQNLIFHMKALPDATHNPEEN